MSSGTITSFNRSKLSILLLLVFFFLCAKNLSAADIVVTSNADSGPGTLREALAIAAGNGNGSIDRITFNMPGTNNTDHIIKIQTELPTITTDVIIDASTQPGEKAAVNGAKVTIDGRSYNYDPKQTKTLFRIVNVSRFELYGMVIREFVDFVQATGDYPPNIIMLEFNGINQKVVLGAPGKGNVIYNTGGLYCQADFRINDDSQIKELIMKSNIIGIKENGIDIATKVIPRFTFFGTSFSEIGGETLEEGNVIYGGVAIGYAEPNQQIGGIISSTIKNNTFSANKDGDSNGYIDEFGQNAVRLYLYNAAANIGPVQFNIERNVFGTELVLLGFYNINAKISGNFFGTSRDRSTKLPMQFQALRLGGMKGRVLIGGSTIEEGNVFTNIGYAPTLQYVPNSVTSFKVENIELSHNTFYCNKGIAFVHENTGPFEKPIEVLLKEKTPNYVAGTTKPGARVELYYTDSECTDCQPKTYFATVNADQNGIWKYTGAIENVPVMASATLNQMTSEFSDPRIYLSTDDAPAFKVTPQTCDLGNGTIKNALAINIANIQWLNEQNEVVANTLDVENLPAGKYRLKGDQFGCVKVSDWVEVENHIPQLTSNTKPEIIHASCGNGGSILKLLPNYYKEIQWLDKDGAIKGSDPDLRNVPAGEYTLRLIGLEGSGCVKDFGPYVIKEVDGPAIDDSAVQISDATCLAPIGSIKNLKVTGAGKLFYVWRDANREIVSEDLDADNLAEGSYKLQVFDESSCGVLESKAFVIKTLDKLELNDQNAVSTPTNCNSATGSIKGITHKGATNFKWLDQDNAVVGNAMELTGVAAGTYRLIISNDLNCTQESRAFTINVAATVYPIYDITLKPSTCNRLDGTININFGTGTPPTEIRVVDQNEATIGNTSALKNLKPGKYKIYFKNVGECETFYKEVEIKEIPILSLNVEGMSVKNDDCGQGKGYIKGINISGGLAPYTYRWVETISGIGLSTLDLSNLHAGNYRLTVSDASSCIVATDAITILDEGTYVEAPFVDPISACPGTSIKVKARHQQSGSGTYSLYEGTTIQPVSTNITGEFKIVADPARSYSLSYKLGLCESVRVPLKLDLSGVVLRIPNTFSPNGDGINDVWSIPDVDKYSNLTISVFNRNGQKVYTGNGTDKPFDGSLNGSILSAGTYFYIIDMKGACGNLTGSITILK